MAIPASTSKFFGDDSPAGQVIQLGRWADYTITGVLGSLHDKTVTLRPELFAAGAGRIYCRRESRIPSQKIRNLIFFV
jgi:hypothetical protein